MPTSRPTPVPPSFPRRGKEGRRDELTLEPPDFPAPENPDSEVFERTTAIPDPPGEPTGLELDFSSLPPARAPRHVPPSNPFELGSIPPLAPDATLSEPPQHRGVFPMRTALEDGIPTLSPAPQRSSDPADRDDRKRTVPEPMVERHIARVESVGPRAAAERRPPVIEPPDLFGELGSPLDLVDAHQDSSDGDRDEFVERAAPSAGPSAAAATVPDMQDRYAVGDFTGALVVAESILDTNPDDEVARRYAQSCREVLTQMYAARIGPMDQVAVVAVPADQITWLSLDHRAGFLLSLVDGVSSIEEILDISGMSRLDALRIMYTLVQQNVITLHH